jgi:hypothetical protein
VGDGARAHSPADGLSDTDAEGLPWVHEGPVCRNGKEQRT